MAKVFEYVIYVNEEHNEEFFKDIILPGWKAGKWDYDARGSQEI